MSTPIHVLSLPIPTLKRVAAILRAGRHAQAPYPADMFTGLEVGPYVQDNHSLFKYGLERGREAAAYVPKDPAHSATSARSDALAAEVSARQFSGHLPPICNGDRGALTRYEYGVVAGVDRELGAGDSGGREAVAA